MRVYVVVRGDTLSGIARRFGDSVAELVALNGISNPNLIHAGERVRLPGVPPPGVPAVPALPFHGVYIVRRGDTLSAIAQRFGTTVRGLALRNHIVNADRIYAGQVLHV